MSLTKNLFGVIEDIGKIVKAPVDIGLSLTRKITKPVADSCEEISKEFEDKDEYFTNDKK